MASTKVDFEGSRGSQLAARLDLPQGAPRAYAVFAHCFTCSMDSKAASCIARALADGFGVLRFDFTGLGGSGGDFAHTHFSSNVDDLVAACDWLRTQHGAPALLLGTRWAAQRRWRRRTGCPTAWRSPRWGRLSTLRMWSSSSAARCN